MARRSDPDKRERILTAARRAFLEQGYSGARMAGIASEAGLAVGTIYLYFKSKEDLAVSLEELLFEHISAEILPLLHGIHTAEGIEEIVEASMRVTKEDADLLRVRTYIPGTPSTVRERCVELFSRGLREQMEDGSIRPYDPDILSDLVFVVMEQAIQKSLTGTDEDVRAYRGVVTKMIQRVLLV